MITRIGRTLLAACLFLPAPLAIATVRDSSTVEKSGSLRAEIRQILDPPGTVGGDKAPADLSDPSLEYYYSKLGARATNVLDPYATAKKPNGTADSSASKKPPKEGQIPEPGGAWLLVAGMSALGLIAFGRRRAR